jgi:nucleoside-diphosphate kinase
MGFASPEEETFIMVKPDGVVRGLAGRILRRFEDKGLRLVRSKLTLADPDILKEHYAHIVDKPFFPEVFSYMTSAPVFQMVFRGVNAVEAGRILLGSTDPMKAGLGTVRGDFGLGVDKNLCHGSDSLESADKEIALWFRDGVFPAAGEAPPLERTMIMVKPDGVSRGLSGKILSRFEDKGLRLIASKHIELDRARLDKHYSHMLEKPFYESEIVPYMESGPCHLMAFQGANAVTAGSTLLGATNPLDAALGTVRGDFGLCVEQNVCHGSRTAEGADREIGLWFDEEELVAWKPPEVLVMPPEPAGKAYS